MRIVQVEQAQGGETGASGAEISPEEAEAALLRSKAVQELNNMSTEEKKALLEKQKKRIEVFSRLDADARFTYMQKQTEEDKLQMLKTQILLVAEMRGEAHHHDHDCPVHGKGNDAKAAAQAAANSVLPAAGKPSQQQMM